MKTLEPRAPALGAHILERDEYRVEGREKVSGQAKYAADFQMPGMLWAAFLRSTTPRARIAAIDVRRARTIPGVESILTGMDVGEHYLGRALLDWPVIARDEVRFIGDTVVAVAAQTREAAEAAVEAIEVRYEELPAVFEPEDALAEGAPILHKEPARYPYLGKARPPVPHPNVQGYALVTKGDVEAGLAQADRVFEHTFTTPRYHGGFIEPRATLVWVDEHAIVHVVSTNKTPYNLREQLAAGLSIPEHSIVIEPAYVGGDFGAKGLSIDEFACYCLARATNRPVKYVRTYLDDMQGTNTRHPAKMTFRTGVDRDGRFVAMDVRVVYNGGAYAAGKPVPTLLPGGQTKTPYRVPHARFERISVYTNTIPSGHVRAPGDIQVHFALESHVDMIARELGADPLEFRLRNAVSGEATDLDGEAYLEPKAVEVLEELRRVTDWGKPPAPGRARGIALAVRHVGGGKGEVKLTLAPSGELRVRTAFTDQGGGMLTVIRRVIAASLGIDPNRIAVERVATDQISVDPGAGGSRGAHVVGEASLDAARQVRAHLEEVGWDGGAATWDRAVREATKRGPLEITGTYASSHAHGEPASHNFSAYAAEVSVDARTGAVTIHDFVLVADVGAILNPVAHRGQLNGGFVFGLGTAWTEDLRVEGGKLLNLNLGEYKLPTTMDIPPLRTFLVHGAGGPGPFGAKMAGELSTSGVAPALANAIAAACGARIMDLPLTAERVFEALAQGNGR